jgi:ADP-ribose pyrophosphatase
VAEPSARRVLYDGRIVRLVLEETPLADGGVRRREIVEHADGAAVVAIDTRGDLLLVRQQRPAVGISLLELPAGMVDPDETPLACARRELEEETGYTCDTLELLASFYSSPGFCNERLYVFLAKDLRGGSAADDADEELELVRMPVARALELLARGDIVDAKTIVGLLAYQARPPSEY